MNLINNEINQLPENVFSGLHKSTRFVVELHNTKLLKSVSYILGTMLF